MLTYVDLCSTCIMIGNDLINNGIPFFVPQNIPYIRVALKVQCNPVILSAERHLGV